MYGHSTYSIMEMGSPKMGIIESMVDDLTVKKYNFISSFGRVYFKGVFSCIKHKHQPKKWFILYK